MTKDVFVSISGMHEEIAETPAVERDEAEAIEVVTAITSETRSIILYMMRLWKGLLK